MNLGKPGRESSAGERKTACGGLYEDGLLNFRGGEWRLTGTVRIRWDLTLAIISGLGIIDNLILEWFRAFLSWHQNSQQGHIREL